MLFAIAHIIPKQDLFTVTVCLLIDYLLHVATDRLSPGYNGSHRSWAMALGDVSFDDQAHHIQSYPAPKVYPRDHVTHVTAHVSSERCNGATVHAICGAGRLLLVAAAALLGSK